MGTNDKGRLSKDDIERMVNDADKSKIGDSDLTSAKAKLDEALAWLDKNQLGEKEEYEEKQKELEQGLKAVVEKMYAAGGQPEQAAGPGAKAPTVEEVD